MEAVKNLLSNYELIPGIAASVIDEEQLGRIKVAFSGDENTSNVKLSSLPWACPFTTTGNYQGFSKLCDGAKVWILRNVNNQYEMWYIPMFELNPNTKNLSANYDNIDILISRSKGSENVQLNYSDSDGMNMSIGGSSVKVNSDKTVTLTSEGGGKVSVNGDNIMLNTDSTNEHLISSNKILDLFDSVNSVLEAVRNHAATNPNISNFVMPSEETFISTLNKFQTQLSSAKDALSKSKVCI